MSQIAIRKARKSDIPSINELNFAMHNYLGKLVGVRFSEDELKEEKIAETDLSKEHYYVAVTGNRVVGYVVFSKKTLEDEWCGRYICLNEVAVAEPFRGKGIGERLVQVAVDCAKRNRLNITTGTHLKNRRGINFYKKLGFRPFSTKLILDLNRKLKL